MRIRENLSPNVQNLVMCVWLMGYGGNFVFALSALWGWHPALGAIGCIALIAMATEDKKAIRQSLKGELKTSDRLIAFYLVGLAATALLVNVAVGIRWLLRT
jgi:hypothetical protein